MISLCGNAHSLVCEAALQGLAAALVRGFSGMMQAWLLARGHSFRDAAAAGDWTGASMTGPPRCSHHASGGLEGWTNGSKAGRVLTFASGSDSRSRLRGACECPNCTPLFLRTKLRLARKR